MPTFAFSTTGSFWKTRYSFEPDCYGSSDNFFVSYKEREPEGATAVDLCWVHNSNKVRNVFYGEQYNSSISVVANENPSAEKHFRAISLETNENIFSAKVKTNVDAGDSSVSKYQEAVIPSFDAREECMYAAVGSSRVNSKMNVQAIGVGGLLSPSYLNKSFVEAFNSGWIQILGNDNGLLPYETKRFSMIPITPLHTSSVSGFGDNTKIGFQFGANIYYYTVSGDNAVEEDFTAQGCYDNSMFSVISIVSNPSSVPPGVYMLLAHEEVDNFNIQLFQLIFSQKTIIAVSNPSINGDPIRGKYALIEIESTPTGDPFELYAVNAEYSASPLDSSR